ncbi:hypothetical protein KTS45_03425 [Halomicroarcula limicola]|uniref:Uncharacterized protein n=1 Tax=Haloarcula limicola TaxID=1429915 RepID=A0A8J7Y2Q1_9EURY|nr:hypothetical protein [Halomicroarcula limicola]MBV0923240.1 hypothetical protein [Halomicroarcula limicola]
MAPHVDDTIADRSLSETGDGDVVTVCAECDGELDPGERTPTVATVADGVTVYLFCDEDCKAAFQRD